MVLDEQNTHTTCRDNNCYDCEFRAFSHFWFPFDTIDKTERPQNSLSHIIHHFIVVILILT